MAQDVTKTICPRFFTYPIERNMNLPPNQFSILMLKCDGYYVISPFDDLLVVQICLIQNWISPPLPYELYFIGFLCSFGDQYYYLNIE